MKLGSLYRGPSDAPLSHRIRNLPSAVQNGNSNSNSNSQSSAVSQELKDEIQVRLFLTQWYWFLVMVFSILVKAPSHPYWIKVFRSKITFLEILIFNNKLERYGYSKQILNTTWKYCLVIILTTHFSDDKWQYRLDEEIKLLVIV